MMDPIASSCGIVGRLGYWRATRTKKFGSGSHQGRSLRFVVNKDQIRCRVIAKVVPKGPSLNNSITNLSIGLLYL